MYETSNKLQCSFEFFAVVFESRNKFEFFISFVKMALSNTFLASISRISQRACVLKLYKSIHNED